MESAADPVRMWNYPTILSVFTIINLFRMLPGLIDLLCAITDEMLHYPLITCRLYGLNTDFIAFPVVKKILINVAISLLLFFSYREDCQSKKFPIHIWSLRELIVGGGGRELGSKWNLGPSTPTWSHLP